MNLDMTIIDYYLQPIFVEVERSQYALKRFPLTGDTRIGVQLANGSCEALPHFRIQPNCIGILCRANIHALANFPSWREISR